jgi:hypothetical protein
VRIFPCKGSDLYDCYFQGNKFLNRSLYRCLYTDEIVPIISKQNGFNDRPSYVLNFQLPNYDSYKKIAENSATEAAQ